MAEKMTITIPIDPVVLRETANMCNRLASSLTDKAPVGKPSAMPDPAPPVAAAAPPVAAAAPPAATVVTPPAPPAATVVTPPAPPAATVVTPPVVELANGIPWDARIHVASKTKYQTSPFGWKLKKQLDPEFVKAVEAELRAGGGAPTPAGMTYAELLAQITAQGVPNEEVLDVLAEFEISSLALLAAKPALIPAFAERLFAGE